MPGTYTIDSKRGIVFSRAWGVLTDEDLIAHAVALGADPRFAPDFVQIADFREIETLAVTPAGIRSLASKMPFAKTSRRAAIVSGDAAYGVARMYQACIEAAGDSLYVCHTMHEALAWVGADPGMEWPTGPVDATFGVDRDDG